MKRDFYTTAARADALLAALEVRIDPTRWIWRAQNPICRPLWGGQTRLHATAGAATSHQDFIDVWQHGEHFRFRNYWCFEVEIRLWPADVMSRKRVFTAAVQVQLSQDIPLSKPVSMDMPWEAEISSHPQPHERDAFKSIRTHNRQLVQILRHQGFRRCARTYTPPRIERFAQPHKPGWAEDAFVWSDSTWRREFQQVDSLADAIASLMNCRLRTMLSNKI